MSVNYMRKIQAVCSVKFPVQSTKKIVPAFATGLFIVIFAAIILTAYANLVALFTPEGLSILNVIVFIILVLIVGYIWIIRKKILPKSVQV